jgi:hypothetical protein
MTPPVCDVSRIAFWPTNVATADTHQGAPPVRIVAYLPAGGWDSAIWGPPRGALRSTQLGPHTIATVGRGCGDAAEVSVFDAAQPQVVIGSRGDSPPDAKPDST